MIDALRVFLDRIASAKPDAGSTVEITEELRRLSGLLEPAIVPEAQRVFGHRRDLRGRGQTMTPAFEVVGGDADSVRGHVTFGDYFLGGGGAAHGGAVPLLFDEVLGRLAASSGRTRCRTAYLHVNYRSITPIGVQLDVTARFVSEVGRKRFVAGEIRHGETLCADADALFIELKPGQP
jgi:acyl-coenzyme A thioesterase PaaI-like protein